MNKYKIVLHYVDVFISVALIILLSVMEILYLQLFFNFTFRIKDNLAKNPTNFQIVMFLLKIIMIFILTRFDLNSSSTYTQFLFIHVVKGFFLCYESLAEFPYHSKNVSKAHGIFCSAYLWINLIFLTLDLIREGTIAFNILYVLGVGLVCFVKLYLNLRNYYAKVIIFYD